VIEGLRVLSMQDQNSASFLALVTHRIVLTVLMDALITANQAILQTANCPQTEVEIVKKTLWIL
jgi:hypothetical protein